MVDQGSKARQEHRSSSVVHTDTSDGSHNRIGHSGYLLNNSKKNMNNLIKLRGIT